MGGAGGGGMTTEPLNIEVLGGFGQPYHVPSREVPRLDLAIRT